MKWQKSELEPRLLSLSADNSFIANCSSPRSVMHMNHMSSRPSLLYPEKKQSVIAGIEYELGKTIDDVRAEEDYILRGIIPKYPALGENNPEVSLLVEFERLNEKTGQMEIWLDLVKVPMYKSKHSYFGYRLTPTEVLTEARHGSLIPKGSVLAKTDSLHDDGSYMSGINANVVAMSHPATADDGYAVSESFLEKLKFTSFPKRVIDIDKNSIPLNLFGDNKYFKMFPDIGETVKAGGLLCAVRQRDDMFCITDMSNDDIKRVDFTFDHPTFVGHDEAVVVDITIHRGHESRIVFSENMTEQLDHYVQLNVGYAERIQRQYELAVKDLKGKYGVNFFPNLTPRLICTVKDEMIYKESITNKRRHNLRKREIDQYRIEIVLMAVVKPDLAFKLSDNHAGKICPFG